MQQTAFPDNKGVTLVEVMIALLVLLFVSLALMQTALVSISANIVNVLRDEAVGIADMRMDDAKSLAFNQTRDDLSPDAASLSSTDCPASFPSTGVLINRSLRGVGGVTGFNFCTNRDVKVIDADTKQVKITLGWKWKGNDYTHTISAIMRRA